MFSVSFSGASGSAVPFSGHRLGDEESPAEVFSCTRLLLLPGQRGGCQPGRGHPSAAAAGHHQTAFAAGERRHLAITVSLKSESDEQTCLCLSPPGPVSVPGLPVRHGGPGPSRHPQQTAAAALAEAGDSRSELGVLRQPLRDAVAGGSAAPGLQ